MNPRMARGAARATAPGGDRGTKADSVIEAILAKLQANRVDLEQAKHGNIRWRVNGEKVEVEFTPTK